MPWVLVTKTWRDHWRGLVGWSLGIVAIVAMVMWVYPSIRSSAGEMEQLAQSYPEAFKEMFRMNDYTSPAGYLSTEFFSFMAPIVFIGVAVTWGSSLTAGEEESGTADLLFTLPVGRRSLLGAKIGAMVAALAALVVLMYVALAVGALAIDMGVGSIGLLAACVGAGLLGLTFGSVAVAVGALTGRRAAALGASIGLAVAAFLLYSLAPLVDALENLTPANPFQWALGATPLDAGFDLGYTVLLVCTSTVLLLASLVAFQRRNINA